MIPNNQKASLLVPYQIPGFIRDNPDYENFIAFIQAYYEWMEQEGNVIDASKNILNYVDIDNTLPQFLNYFVNDFLPYFPEDALISKSRAIKFARQLYQTKGTIGSYQLLFRMLYNSDFDVFYTEDAVLKASAGVWYVPRSLKLATVDTRFLSIQNYRVFGETSKSFATIESSILAENKVEIFISNIERLFQSGEYIRVVDNNNQDVIINGSNLRAKIVGQISQINIATDSLGNPIRGLFYNPGDPVILYGGLNPTVVNPVGATAVVGSVTSGSVQQINVVDGGFGYSLYPNTILTFSNLNPGAIGPIAEVASVDPNPANTANLNFVIMDSIIRANNIQIGATNYFFYSGTSLQLATPSNFASGHVVYQGSSLGSSTFQGTATAVDTQNSILYFSSTTGSITNGAAIIDNSNASVQANVTGYNVIAGNTHLYYSIRQYIPGEIVYQGSSFSTATFYGTVLSFNPTSNIMMISSVGPNPSTSVPTISTSLTGSTSGVVRTLNSYTTSNANTTLANAFTFLSMSTYPISSVIVENGGGGISTLPTVTAESLYGTDNPLVFGNLGNLGILAPIQIQNGGNNYSVSDTITITGGRGLGAYANITSIGANGVITGVQYKSFADANGIYHYPAGGIGYTSDDIPTVTVTSATGSNASLYIPGILATDATFSLSVNRAGAITTIDIINFGIDYDAQPNVSLRVQDLVVSGLNPLNLPTNLEVAYQGSSLNAATYIATVDSIQLLQGYANPEESLYNLRLFNYNSSPDPTLPINIVGKSITATISDISYPQGYFSTTSPAYTNGIKTYGDGNAQAVATFLNGLVIGQGQYIGTRGQLSSFDVLQSSTYNNYTYQITVEKEIAKYRDILLNLLHPAGMQVIGRYSVRNSQDFDTASENANTYAYPLYHFTETAATTATIKTDFVNYGSNVVTFNNLSAAALEEITTVNTIIALTGANGPNVLSKITSIDYVNNKITLADSTWLTYGNVAYASANSGSYEININAFTGAYDIINNGKYTNSKEPLADIVYAGDKVLLGSNTYTVVSVNPIGNSIQVTPAIAATTANSLLSVNRTFIAGGSIENAYQILLYQTTGSVFQPQLTTESGLILTTESGQILVLG